MITRLAPGRYHWRSAETDDEGETHRYHQARWHELYSSMRGYITGSILQHTTGEDCDDLCQLALLDMWNFFERTPAAARNNDSWIKTRAYWYARGRWHRMKANQEKSVTFAEYDSVHNLTNNGKVGYKQHYPSVSADPLEVGDTVIENPRSETIAIVDDIEIEIEPFNLEDVLCLLVEKSHRCIVEMLARGVSTTQIAQKMTPPITARAVRYQIGTIRAILEQHGGRDLFRGS